MSYVTYFDDWPKLDDSLLQDALYIRDQNENIFPVKESPYKLYAVNDRITNFIGTFLKMKHAVNVHSFMRVPIHVDFNRTIAYNYIIDTGGPDAKTLFYDINDILLPGPGKLQLVNENCKPIESISIRSNVWHKINVSIPHTVINIKTPRTGITVTPMVN
jgi:hypothetical protein